MVRRGSAIKARRKTDPENLRLAGTTEHDCEYYDRRVTNQIIFYQKKWTQYKDEPYWHSKCTNCKKVLNHRY